MSLDQYFAKLITKVEASSDVTNQGKDANGFFLPTRAVLLRQLHVLKDLHDKPRAKAMVRDAWKFVVEHAPPEWLVLSDTDKDALKKVLG